MFLRILGNAIHPFSWKLDEQFAAQSNGELINTSERFDVVEIAHVEVLV